jgi:hypothetical protein
MAGGTDEIGQAGFGTSQAGSPLAYAAKPARSVPLADYIAKPVSEPAKSVPLVPGATNASLNDLAPFVDCFLQ